MTTRPQHDPSILQLTVLILPSGWAFVEQMNPFLRLLAISFSIFVIVKFLSERHYLKTSETRPRWRDRVAWYLFWAGLDPQAFFCRRESSHSTTSEWLFASLKTLFGIGLLVGVAPLCLTWHKMTAGWIAMVGLIFTLHFGLFHLAALAWRRVGRRVEPIMQAPILSTSLNEFWSRRWNLAFRDFAHEFVFRPMVRQRHARLAEWACFAFSGLIHELAISIPAGAGYGMPFAYFMWQAVGVWLERRLPGLKRNRFVGWCFTAAFTIPGVYWLFHPMFVRRLILPLIGG
ncbi:MAG: MBOAT family protein [Planctomycetia bacterium]|nr:MBOAT family protein [Planctomycetia bacterium]